MPHPVPLLRPPAANARRLLLNNFRRITSGRTSVVAPTPPHSRTVLVIGSSGALGGAVVDRFLLPPSSRRFGERASVIGADVLPGPASRKLDAFLPLSPDELPGDASGRILDHLGGSTEGGGGGASSSSPMTGIRPHVPLLDAVVVAAGSFAPVHPREADFAEHVLGMYDANVLPVALGVHVAACSLREGGTLVIVGASAALAPTPAFLGYGMAKSALHHLVQSITEKSGVLPPGAGAVGVLPGTFDTEANRRSMDHDGTWVGLGDVAERIGEWIEAPELRPASGSLVKAMGIKGKTVFKLVR